MTDQASPQPGAPDQPVAAGWEVVPPAQASAWNPPPPPPSAPSPLSRYRGWQWTTIGLIIAGLVVALFALGIGGLSAQQPELHISAVYVLVTLAVGAGLFVIGAVGNLLRAIVVRRGLPVTRYRGGSVLLMLLLAAFAANTVSLLFTDDVMAMLTGEPGTGDIASLVLLTVLQASLLVVTALFVLLPRALGALPFFPGRTLRAVGLGIAWAIPAWVVATLLGIIVERVMQRFDIAPEPQIVDNVIGTANPAIVVVAVVVVAPIAEEVFFRGVAFSAWAREYGVRRAVVMSALLFAVIHLSLAALLPIFVLGVALAVIYWRTHNLASSMALHATFNAISVVLALLVRFGVMPPST